jgi:hypothetical protein
MEKKVNNIPYGISIKMEIPPIPMESLALKLGDPLMTAVRIGAEIEEEACLKATAPTRFNTKTKEYYKVLEAGKAVVDHYAKTDFMSDDFASSRTSEEVLSRAWNAMENTNDYKTASFAVMWELDLKEEIKEYFTFLSNLSAEVKETQEAQSISSATNPMHCKESSDCEQDELMLTPGTGIKQEDSQHAFFGIDADRTVDGLLSRFPNNKSSTSSTRRPDYKKVRDLQEHIFNLLQDPKCSYDGIAETIAEALSVTFRLMNEELKPTWDQQKLAIDTLSEKFKNKESYYTIMNGVI